MAKKRILLVQGGMGAEREVSLITGQAFQKALMELGHDFEVLDAQEDLPKRLTDYQLDPKTKFDLALLALHGKYAEDGIVQGICEYLKLPYTGCGVMASSLCMDKILSKQIFRYNNIPTAREQFVNAQQDNLDKVKLDMPLPVVVKPSREGSSVGISIVKEASDFTAALKTAAKYDYEILIEEYIDGLELTVPILGNKALTPIEIEPKLGFYDYKNKYTAGKTDYILPPRVSDDVIEKLKEYALAAFKACRVRSYARVDFRMGSDNEPKILEINTLPGCTPTSLVPKSAAYDGISFNQFVEQVIQSATLDYEGVQ